MQQIDPSIYFVADGELAFSNKWNPAQRALVLSMILCPDGYEKLNEKCRFHIERPVDRIGKYHGNYAVIYYT